MSRSRRRPARGGRQGGNAGNARSGGQGRQGQNRQGQGRQSRQARTAEDTFWGEPDSEPRTVERIRPTTDPAAVPRSLGEPPLTPDTAAPHHLAVVYEEAVRAATALAAANGLLEDPDLGDVGGSGDRLE